jgi:hypothetical protein
MLTMTNSLTFEGFTVFHDDTNNPLGFDDRAASGGTGVANARRFYVLPNDPVLATDDGGKPLFSLIVYRNAEERIDPDTNQDVGGGILTFTVELSVPQNVLKKIRGRLATMVFGDEVDEPGNDVELTVVPFQGGNVVIKVADPGSEEEPEVIGSGKVSGIGNNRKAVMVRLSQAGAALFAQLEGLPCRSTCSTTWRSSTAWWVSP